MTQNDDILRVLGEHGVGNTCLLGTGHQVIEQDADTVMLIHRLDKNKKRAGEDEEPMDHNTLLILAKQRNGPTPEIKLNFIGEHTTFRNVTEKAYSNNKNERQK